MEAQGTEIVTRVKVEFTEEEYKLLIYSVKTSQSLSEFIHDVVMRSLKRKARKAKVNVDEEAFLQKAKEDE